MIVIKYALEIFLVYLLLDLIGDSAIYDRRFWFIIFTVIAIEVVSALIEFVKARKI